MSFELKVEIGMVLMLIAILIIAMTVSKLMDEVEKLKKEVKHDKG